MLTRIMAVTIKELQQPRATSYVRHDRRHPAHADAAVRLRINLTCADCARLSSTRRARAPRALLADLEASGVVRSSRRALMSRICSGA
jgi:hypothetical protein